MKTIRSRAPLRLGLAGGGTDVSPYCDVFGGYILNVTIDRYAYAFLSESTSRDVTFIACDGNTEESFECLDSNIDISTAKLPLHSAVYRHIMINFNNGIFLPVKLSTYCDAPPGSGLGSSSTLVVAMVKAFVEYLNLPVDDYRLGQLAYTIERIECGFKGGKQDQFSSTFGGFNFMEFYAEERTLVNPLRIRNWIQCELEASLVLCYSGISRESALIISDQSASVASGESVALNAMHGIKEEAVRMKDSLLRGDFDGIVESMKFGWENKKLSSPLVSNPRLDSLFDVAISHGALAGKVSGAGGGGYMTFYTKPEKRVEVVAALEEAGASVANCHFTQEGVQAWRIYE